MAEQLYVIWSWHHSQWWAPDEAGYTPHVEEAGRYTQVVAGRIHTQSGLPGRNTAIHERTAVTRYADMDAPQIEEELDGVRRL